jgi:chromosome segregation ATPase
MERDLTKI